MYFDEFWYNFCINFNHQNAEICCVCRGRGFEFHGGSCYLWSTRVVGEAQIRSWWIPYVGNDHISIHGAPLKVPGTRWFSSFIGGICSAPSIKFLKTAPRSRSPDSTISGFNMWRSCWTCCNSGMTENKKLCATPTRKSKIIQTLFKSFWKLSLRSLFCCPHISWWIMMDQTFAWCLVKFFPARTQ